jgi:large subunit ribosomal protein L17
MFRNLVTALLEHERIRTTDPKAKEVRRLTERMITLGKRGSLHARRHALSFIRKRSVVGKLFAEVAPRFANRPGGYTRVIKLGLRRGDAAPQSILELTERAAAEAPAEKHKAGTKRRAGAAATRGGGGKPAKQPRSGRRSRKAAAE